MIDGSSARRRDALLQKFGGLSDLVDAIDSHLIRRHPRFFGPRAVHPVLPLKRRKVVHDNLLGTNYFSWPELMLIDSPLLQRLRDIQQVGLAYQVYPSARHTRFEHTLGVAILATKVLANIIHNQQELLTSLVAKAYDQRDPRKAIAALQQELRLAALLHDVGHSISSHTSERIYATLPAVQKAAFEVSLMAGKEKGAGEVLSLAVALSPAVWQLLLRASESVQEAEGGVLKEVFDYVDMINVAMLIIGRSVHPQFQFVGDIISSALDADKLDYLQRDAAGAGLPMKYDLERFLFSVRAEEQPLADGESRLQVLYDLVIPAEKPARIPVGRHEGYAAFRLQLPATAVNTVEQIIISKMMLFGYIYHHSKVRAGEGMLAAILQRLVSRLEDERHSDLEILTTFLNLSDSAMWFELERIVTDEILTSNLYRLRNRILPREVMKLGGFAPESEEEAALADYLREFADPERSETARQRLEGEIVEEVRRLGCDVPADHQDALDTIGAWVDVPRPPRFGELKELVLSGKSDVPVLKIFPVEEWSEAYIHYRYFVRIYAFSEYFDQVRSAAVAALSTLTEVKDSDFWARFQRRRS